MSDNNTSNALTEYILAQAHNNRWSNHRLHNACARIPETEYLAKRQSFFGSIHDHLDHIVYVDWLYMERLTGRQLLPNDVGSLLHDGLQTLAKDQVAVDEALIDFCNATTPDILSSKVSFRLADGTEIINAVSCILSHLFMHQTHHRGQVHNMLSATSVKPPQLDEFFMAADFPLRKDELELLGLPLK